MAQSKEQIATKASKKPERVKLNIATHEGKHLKINIKLKWSVHQLKEHLYDHNYFPQPPFNQTISFQGTDLSNMQTFEEIYDAIQNKHSQKVLHSLRGKLTWEPDDDYDVDKLTQDNDDDNVDDDDSKQTMLTDTQTIPEISLYIRSKRTPKMKLHTLTSNEPVIQEFIATQNRESIITVKSPLPSDHDASSSDSSSSSHFGGYQATAFNPEALRRKQEKKALKKLHSPLISAAVLPESPQIKFIEQEELQPKHALSESVIFHELDANELRNEESSDSSADSQINRARSISPDDDDDATDSNSSSKHSKSPPIYIDEEAATDEHEVKSSETESIKKRIKKRRSARLSLYADISSKRLIAAAQASAEAQDSDSDNNNDAQQTPLTHDNLYMHETGQKQDAHHARGASRVSSKGSWAESGASIDWGNGPFIVRRMSVGSVGSGFPSNLGFYHTAKQSSHLWELELPEYYDIPDSLQRVYSKLDMKATKQSSYIEPVDEDNILENTEEEPLVIKQESSKSVTFNANIVVNNKSDEEEEDKKEDEIENVNVSKWKIKQIGVDDKYVNIDRIQNNDDDDNESDSTDSKFNESESDRNQIEVNVSQLTESDESESDLTSRRSNGIYDEVVVKRDKLRRELTWKTSYFGIWLIGCVWFASFHCLYSFSAIVNNIVYTLNVKLFEFGLMYSFNFIGVGIGLFISSYLLNGAKWMNSSHSVAKYSIFVVFLCQCIATIIFLYEYVIDSNSSPDVLLWSILVLSRGFMGIAIGFVESSLNNLVFEWFSNDAFNAKLSALHGNTHAHEAQKQYLATLSTRVLSYCMFLKEFGHISARLFLVPMIYLTFSDSSNLFAPLLFGVVISGCGWIGLIYASFRDNKCASSYQQIMDEEEEDYHQDIDSESAADESESSPLLPAIQSNNLSKKHKRSTIPHDWSYSDWYEMELIGLNQSVVLSIIFLSINFGVSFSFTILSITNLCQQYAFTDFTANLLICCIPFATLFASNWLRQHLLAKINSIWTVMFVGCILYIVLFAAFAFVEISGKYSVWLPITCIILFIFASECAFASGYELLLSSAPEYIHALISGLNSSTNFIISGICILIFSVLVIDYSDAELDTAHQYRWAYAFCCFISIINLFVAIILRYSFGANVQALN